MAITAESSLGFQSLSLLRQGTVGNIYMMYTPDGNFISGNVTLHAIHQEQSEG
jgi:hypothetical protein